MFPTDAGTVPLSHVTGSGSIGAKPLYFFTIMHSSESTVWSVVLAVRRMLQRFRRLHYNSRVSYRVFNGVSMILMKVQHKFCIVNEKRTQENRTDHLRSFFYNSHCEGTSVSKCWARAAPDYPDITR